MTLPFSSRSTLNSRGSRDLLLWKKIITSQLVICNLSSAAISCHPNNSAVPYLLPVLNPMFSLFSVLYAWRM
ncbi:uncharacterized protein BJX67DRAFT_267 [Aspergillus lucknowensis]|uniref:Uncharacterized protein n=1 Tax=Aspergillus lucknowensis TaxID=176173 RepID=A0ABR4M6K9_9EURO